MSCAVDEPLFFRKPVRDLHWVLASSNLIAEGGSISVLSDAWCAALVERSIPWLRELERNPDELVNWLSRQRNVRRLGFYFAALLEFWVRHCPHLAERQTGAESEPLVLTQQQIHVGLQGEVAGQLKCVFQRRIDPGETETGNRDGMVELAHWESHVKYFAFVLPDDPMLPQTSSLPLRPIRSKSGRPLSLAPPSTPVKSSELPSDPPATTAGCDKGEMGSYEPLEDGAPSGELRGGESGDELLWRRALLDVGVPPCETALAEYVGPFLGENLLQRAVEMRRKLSLSAAPAVRCALRVSRIRRSHALPRVCLLYSFEPYHGLQVRSFLASRFGIAAPDASVSSESIMRGYLFYPLHPSTADAIDQATDHHFHDRNMARDTVAAEAVAAPAAAAGGEADSAAGAAVAVDAPLRGASRLEICPALSPRHLRGWWTRDIEQVTSSVIVGS